MCTDASQDRKKNREVKVERKVLAKNDEFAEANRKWLTQNKTIALNLISSPGSGKTTLLEKTLQELENQIGCGVIVGDLQTDNDARRLSGKGARIRQIETVSSCHLDAKRIAPFLCETAGEAVKLLFIENVGNLVCPAAYDLGEHAKVSLLSVTEGEDKPEKYPIIFSRSQAVIITKTDLIPHLDWDRDKCMGLLQRVAPQAKIIEVSAKTGEGMPDWISYLRSLIVPFLNSSD